MIWAITLSLMVNIGGFSHFFAPEDALIFQQEQEKISHNGVEWLYFCNGHECTEEELQDSSIMPEDCTQAQVDSGNCGMGRRP